VKIKSLTLTDFRAFPGPAPQSFNLDGKNLLVYGENGAGKSSIFHALRDFFSFKPTKPIQDHKNVFSGQPDADCRVTIEFADGTAPVAWSKAHHPGSKSIATGDPRVKEAALRRSCLDYRSVLDTNYLHGDNEINLFHIAVKQLVHDFPVTVAGGVTKTVEELWQQAINAEPVTRYQSHERVNEACALFNAGFNQALTALHPRLITLLGELLGTEVTLSPFQFPGVTYQTAHQTRDRKFNGQEVKIDITFRGHQPVRPQNFLNEARLSALGLAIYLAGRLTFVPTAATPSLKLLVLDDVLIGLDHSNRLPVLEVLKKHFVDWQIVLLTHDRVWFEMARMYTQDSNLWSYAEVYESEDVDRGIPYPIVRKVNDKAAYGCLEQARKFLADHHVPASANYARASFELALKLFCQRFAVPVQFNMDPRHVDTENLLSAVERWIKDHAAKATMAGVIEGVKLFRKVVLNPYSHASPPNIAEAEVKGAISAIERLLDTLDPKKATDKKLLEITRSLLAAPTPTVEDVVTAMSYLRAAFTLSLRSYCERKRVAVAYSNALSSNRQLWDKAKTDVTHPIPHTIVPAVEAHGHILIDEPSLVTVTGLTQITVQAALAAIEVAGCPEKTVLD